MKIYNKLVLDMEDWSVLSEDSFDYEGPVALAAGGMLTKQGILLSARYLNDVNDATQGGITVGVPAGAPAPAVSQTLPGDRMVLDDATALALSDTAVGTLYGGIYMYAQYKTTTRAAVLGGIAFYKQADVGTNYIVYGDAQPATATPSFIAGIFISAPTANNFCWIQIAGVASVLFDSSVTATTVGSNVSAKVSSTVASTADNAATVSQMTVACLLGVSIQTVTASAVTQVALIRSPFGRI